MRVSVPRMDDRAWGEPRCSPLRQGPISKSKRRTGPRRVAVGGSRTATCGAGPNPKNRVACSLVTARGSHHLRRVSVSGSFFSSTRDRQTYAHPRLTPIGNPTGLGLCPHDSLAFSAPVDLVPRRPVCRPGGHAARRRFAPALKWRGVPRKPPETNAKRPAEPADLLLFIDGRCEAASDDARFDRWDERLTAQ